MECLIYHGRMKAGIFVAIICHIWYINSMEFNHLVEIVGEEPVFESGLLLAGTINPVDVRRQLSRWVKTGKIWRLRRGLYALAPPFQKVKPHPFVVANRLVHGSYVSLQSALAYYGVIPEYVPLVTSVTTNRPWHWDTPLGSYDFRHIKIEMFRGYRLTVLTPGQEAFIATPEKALLDMVYLQVGGDSLENLSWGKVVDDARPFLESTVDITLLTKENTIRLLKDKPKF